MEWGVPGEVIRFPQERNWGSMNQSTSNVNKCTMRRKLFLILLFVFFRETMITGRQLFNKINVFLSSESQLKSVEIKLRSVFLRFTIVI